MSAAAVIALLSEVIANLPAAITTGREVIQFVNDGYRQLSEAIGDREVTADEVNALVAKIVSNSVAIQAID
jgi:iron-sulfur cluster repair protein YtfE (RIC family)